MLIKYKVRSQKKKLTAKQLYVEKMFSIFFLEYFLLLFRDSIECACGTFDRHTFNCRRVYFIANYFLLKNATTTSKYSYLSLVSHKTISMRIK